MSLTITTISTTFTVPSPLTSNRQTWSSVGVDVPNTNPTILTISTTLTVPSPLASPFEVHPSPLELKSLMFLKYF